MTSHTTHPQTLRHCVHVPIQTKMSRLKVIYPAWMGNINFVNVGIGCKTSLRPNEKIVVSSCFAVVIFVTFPIKNCGVICCRNCDDCDPVIRSSSNGSVKMPPNPTAILQAPM